MKKLLLMTLGLFSFSVLAQVVPAAASAPSQDIGALFAALGGLGGASVLGGVAALVQLLIMILKSDMFNNLFHNVSGAAKLSIVTGLTLVSGVLAMMVGEHMSLGAALMNSATLSAVMVYGNQLYQEFTAKPAAPASPPAA